MGEQNAEEKRPAFASNRRTGSSWNRGGNSGWNVGAKDQWRARRGGRESSAEAQDGDSDCSNEYASASGSEGKKNASSFRCDPKVSVQKGKDSFEVDGSVVTEAHPDELYNIITDYDNNARVFRSVDKVEVEDKGGEKVVTQHLRWSFLMWSGSYNVSMRMKTDAEKRAIYYNLDKQGFLKVFNGSFTVEPIAVEGKPTVSKLIIHQEVLPSFMPPGPLASRAGTYTSRIMSGQLKNLLTDVAKEASEVTKAGASAA